MSTPRDSELAGEVAVDLARRANGDATPPLSDFQRRHQEMRELYEHLLDAALYVKKRLVLDFEQQTSEPVGPTDRIDVLQLPGRVRTRLEFEGVRTVGDLCRLTERELADMRGVGALGVKDTLKILHKHGLDLAEYPAPAPLAFPQAQP